MIIQFRNFLPSLLADLGIVIAIAGALIWAYLIYSDIQNRDKIDFDELAIDSSSLVNPANIDQNNTNAGNAGDISALASNALFGAGCVGSACCDIKDWASITDADKGTKSYFNSSYQTCQLVPASWVGGTIEPVKP